jgi:phospholipase C
LQAVTSAPDTNVDPDPDFEHVTYQMYGRTTYDPAAEPSMDHFVRSYQQTCENAVRSGDHPEWTPHDVVRHSHNVMNCHSGEDVQVLKWLASNFALCANWYSSLPGPTLPNRLFAHLGTSLGRVDMDAFDIDATISIYEVLRGAGVSSTIYSGSTSVALTFPKLWNYQDRYFGTLDDFYQDCAEGRLPRYCFIEPRYASEWANNEFRPQNDQHPDSDLLDGEELILSIYHAIRRNKAIWEHSAFIVTYDEHGGLFDHCVPPMAVPPDKVSADSAPFNFTRYGVRVPAVIVSPYTPHLIIEDICDHTSLIACARKRLTGTWKDDTLLGKRAQSAYPLDKAFGTVLRTDIPDIPDFRIPPRRLPRPKRLNHLQQTYLKMTKTVEKSLPAHKRAKAQPSGVTTDRAAQAYFRRVYALAAGFPTTAGRG